MFECGEEALHHSHLPAAAFCRHGGSHIFAVQQLPVGRGAVLAALIGLDQELIGFDLAVAQGPVQGFQHQGEVLQVVVAVVRVKNLVSLGRAARLSLGQE